ncbi:MAG: CDP-alcohol phosphatidyltransferase family protein [Thermoplasmatota archaeon]
MRILRMVSIADIFTLVNALLGFSAVLLVVEGFALLAIYAIIAGILCDGLDGMLARRFSRKWYFGDYLDVMADTTSFCVAPAVVVFATARGSLEPIAGGCSDALLLAACAASVVCGLLRLARFCYMSGGHSSVFTGLPSPASALMISLLTLQSLLSATPLPRALGPVAAAVLAPLMISDLRYPKVRGTYAIASGLVILFVVVTERFASSAPIFEFLLDLALLLALAYIVLGPLAARRAAEATARRPGAG